MRTYGDIDFLQNQIQQAAFKVETNFPANPPVGRIVFKNKVLYICVDISGIPVWIPLTNEISTYIHTVTTASNTWTITHNLNTTTPVVQIYRQIDQTVTIPNMITVISDSVIQVDFTSPEAGRAVIIEANQNGNDRPSVAYEYTQTSGSTTWTINHNLGRNPIIRVFIGNAEVIPDTITHINNFTTVITFSSPQVGTARAI